MLVMMQLPAIASALGGGVAIGTLGAAGHAWARTRGGITAMRHTSLRRTVNTLRADAQIAGKTVGRVASIFR
jgi:type IV secretion system protein VirB6